MKYALIDADGSIVLASNDDTITELPIGAIGLTDEHFSDWPSYKLVGGEIVYSPIAKPFTEEKLEKLAQFRATRLALLDVISGMGWAALVEGDTATANALADFRRGLLDLPQHATVTAATDIYGLNMAMAVRYKQLTDALPAAVKTSFKALV